MLFLNFLVTLILPCANAANDFPRDYVNSRDEFRQTVERFQNPCRASLVESFKIPSRVDQDLTVDAAYFGRHGHQLLILQSGIHGVEGPAGAAAQMMFLREQLPKFFVLGVDVLLIHALDPYGYKYGRRTDEENINLNRNFLGNEARFAGRPSAYAQVRDILEPSTKIKSARNAYLASKVRLVAKLVTSGFKRRQITDAMNSGQYQFAQGLNYGGTDETAQVLILKDLLARILPGHDRVIFVDLHTGLGEKGVLHLMPGTKSDPSLKSGLREAVEATGKHHLAITETSAKGFFQTSGDVIDFVAEQTPASVSLLSLTAEFGTRGTSVRAQLISAARLIAENQAHHHGCSSARACAKIKDDFVELFNPDDAIWRERVLKGAGELFDALELLFKP